MNIFKYCKAKIEGVVKNVEISKIIQGITQHFFQKIETIEMHLGF